MPTLSPTRAARTRSAALAMLAALLAACAGAPQGAADPPVLPAPAPVAALPESPPAAPRSCAAIEAEMGNDQSLVAAAAGLQGQARAHAATSIGTGLLSTALGFVPVPGVSAAGGLVLQGIQAAQEAALHGRIAAVESSIEAMLLRQQRLAAEHRAAGCSADRPPVPAE